MNTKILLRTLTNQNELQNNLKTNNFNFQLEEENLRVEVPYADVKVFEGIIQKYLNAPYNYANVKFPDKKLNIIVFPNKIFLVSDKQTDSAAKEWALAIGLSKPETEWTTFYDKSL